MKMQHFLHKALFSIACAGGLILAVGCSSYRHHGPEHREKGDRIERSAPAADHAPMRMKEHQGRPEMGQDGMAGRMQGPGMGMRGQGPGMGMRGGEGPGLAANMLLSPRLVKELGLSDDQVKQIRAIAERNKEQRRALAESQRGGQEKVRELMESASPDKQAIMSQIEESGRNMIEMRKLQVGEMLEIQNVLTPEQLKKARELRRGPEGMGGRGMGMRPGRVMDRGPMDRPQGGIGRPQDGEGHPGPASQTF